MLFATLLGRSSMKRAARLRFDFWTGLISAALKTYLLVLLWEGLYRDHAPSQELASRTTAYAILAYSLVLLQFPWTVSDLPFRVRDGRVVFDLISPFPLVARYFAEQIGVATVNATKSIVTVAMGALLGALSNSGYSAGTILLGVLSVLLGSTLALQLNLFVGFSAFWSLETNGYFILYRMAATFLSGGMVPLFLFPLWAQDVLAFSPFQYQINVPVQMLMGSYGAVESMQALLGQAIWVVVMFAALRLVENRARHHALALGG